MSPSFAFVLNFYGSICTSMPFVDAILIRKIEYMEADDKDEDYDSEGDAVIRQQSFSGYTCRVLLKTKRTVTLSNLRAELCSSDNTSHESDTDDV